MTINSVDEMWSRANATSTSPDGQKYTASFSSAYQVVHSYDETRVNILDDSRIPQLGDVFGEGGQVIPGVFCVNRSLNRISPIYSIVDVQWQGEHGPNGPEDDPLNATPEITRSNKLVNVPVDQDFYGNPITNSVGDPIDGVTTEISDFSLTVKRNYASISQYAIRQYLRSHNSDFFDEWPPGTARFRTYSAKEIRTKERTYQEVTATIEFREPYNTIPGRAWFARYRNEGMRERVGVQVTFTGGGGTGAAGYAITNASGAVTKIVVTNRGKDYTTAPTVVIGSDNGTGITNGSGATATATINGNGEVTSVSVGAGGSNYFSQLVKCVDSTGKEVSKPVLLAADGSQLVDTDEAFWIERPMSAPLPYSVLGLLD